MLFKKAQSKEHKVKKKKIYCISHTVSLLFAFCYLHFTLCFFLFILCPLIMAAIKDRVVAFVDNTAITLSEFEEVYSNSLKATPGITKEEVLDAMVNRVLLLREAKRIRLEASSDDELLKEYIDLKLKPFIKIREEEVLDFYHKHIEDFQGKEFDTVREEIENYLAERELNQLLKRHIDELRRKAYIKIQLMETPQVK
jgi:hypothetical protein